jgi:hypothetical protein
MKLLLSRSIKRWTSSSPFVLDVVDSFRCEVHVVDRSAGFKTLLQHLRAPDDDVRLLLEQIEELHFPWYQTYQGAPPLDRQSFYHPPPACDKVELRRERLAWVYTRNPGHGAR